MATKKAVEAKLRELTTRLGASEEARASLARALTTPRTIQVRCPDLAAEWWTELAGGRMRSPRRGSVGDPDILIEADSDELIGAIDGSRSLFTGYLSGRVKVRASLSDLLALRRLT